MNTENTSIEATKEVQAALIEFPDNGPMTVPTGYIKFEEEDQAVTAEVVALDSHVNANGKPYLNLTLQMATGRTTHRMWVNTPKAAANTLRQLKRAFGIEKMAEADNVVGQKCSLSTRYDEFAGRITVAFINRYNKYANDVVDLASLDALVAEAEAEQPQAELEF